MRNNAKLNRNLLLTAALVLFLCIGTTASAFMWKDPDIGAFVDTTVTLKSVFDVDNKVYVDNKVFADLFITGFLTSSIINDDPATFSTTATITAPLGMDDVTTMITADGDFDDRSFNSDDDDFNLGSYFNLTGEAAVIDNTGFGDAGIIQTAQINIDNFGLSTYRLDFLLSYTMEARTIDWGTTADNSVARTDLIVSTDDSLGVQEIENRIGQSVNGLGEFLVKRDIYFSMTVADGDFGTLLIDINEASTALTDQPADVIPIPDAGISLLLGSSLLGLAVFQRRKKS